MRTGTEQEPEAMQEAMSRNANACDLQGRCGQRGAWPLFFMAAALVALGAVTGSTGWFWLGGIAAASALFWEAMVRLARAAGRERGGC